MSRLFALLLIATVGTTGALPSVQGYRCIAMDKRMVVAELECCPKCDAPSLSIGEPCCEPVPSARLDVRESAPKSERIAPASFVGLMTFAMVLDGQSSAARPFDAHSRGRPPGEQLQLFSSILRI